MFAGIEKSRQVRTLSCVDQWVVCHSLVTADCVNPTTRSQSLSPTPFRSYRRNLTERGGFEVIRLRNLLLKLYLHLKAGEFRDLWRLNDVLKLHGFLPSFDAH